MKKITIKVISLVLSSILLIASLAGCNRSSNAHDTSSNKIVGTSGNDSQAASEKTRSGISENKKAVFFGKEYESVNHYFMSDGAELRNTSFQIAKYYLQGNKEKLKGYYASEEDWAENNDMPDTDFFKDLSYFGLDNTYIAPSTDSSGREVFLIIYDVIFGDHDADSFDYIEISMVQNDQGEWKTTGVARTK